MTSEPAMDRKSIQVILRTEIGLKNIINGWTLKYTLEFNEENDLYIWPHLWYH